MYVHVLVFTDESKYAMLGEEDVQGVLESSMLSKADFETVKTSVCTHC